MKIIESKRLNGVYLIKHEILCESGIESGISIDNQEMQDIVQAVFVQENEVLSKKNVLRGMGYQKIHPQGKLIQVMQGAIYDVIVDMRTTSKSYGEWEGFLLNGRSYIQLWIPPGFAHGYHTLKDNTKILYKCTEYYYPEEEEGFLWNDQYVNINWQLENGEEPIISERDKKWGAFKKCHKF